MTTQSNATAPETGEHSVFQSHSFASSCWGCLVHTRCVRYLAGEAQGYELGLFCEGCTEARAALGETK
jgi:hypothetical protein